VSIADPKISAGLVLLAPCIGVRAQSFIPSGFLYALDSVAGGIKLSPPSFVRHKQGDPWFYQGGVKINTLSAIVRSMEAVRNNPTLVKAPFLAITAGLDQVIDNRSVADFV
jgi:hypothetical protein